VSKAEIAAGINRSMADRALALVRRVGPEPEIMITGGVAKNVAIKREIEKELGVEIIYPDIDPQIIGAYGAAAYAMAMGESR
jgi:activator of 2-hydroxyglutaryl-CoA dehydratase